jgi:hypothetical protein
MNLCCELNNNHYDILLQGEEKVNLGISDGVYPYRKSLSKPFPV